MRVITYYQADADHVAEVIKREFDLDLKNSVDKRNTEPDRFGYRAINYVCSHQAKRTNDVEYKKFASVVCEIQITSILSHAWSEIEHEWYDLKDAYPDEVKRRFSRLSALSELAESEFTDIRKQRTQYERSVAVRVQAKVPDLTIDALSLRPFIEQEPIVSEIDNALAAALGATGWYELSDSAVEATSRAANLAGITTLQNLRGFLEKYRLAVPEFVARCKNGLWPAMAGNAIDKGLCIFHLVLLVVSSRGESDAMKFLADHQQVTAISWAMSIQVSIAKEIIAKY